MKKLFHRVISIILVVMMLSGALTSYVFATPGSAEPEQESVSGGEPVAETAAVEQEPAAEDKPAEEPAPQETEPAQEQGPAGEQEPAPVETTAPTVPVQTPEQPFTDITIPEDLTREDAALQLAEAAVETIRTGETGMDVDADDITFGGDSTADTETAQDWEATLAGLTLTGDYGADTVAVAMSQLGYNESTDNYIILNEKVYGYTRYGAFYGIPYGDWCCMFVVFCLYYAGVPSSEVPYSANVYDWVRFLKAKDMYEVGGSGYIPSPGDIIFLDWQPDGVGDHAGVVKEVEFGADGAPVRVYTVEGNSANTVRIQSYAYNDSRIFGYGVLPGHEGSFKRDFECSVPMEMLSKMDFTSQRLLVRATPDVFTEDTYVLGRYNGLYLLSFRSAEETRHAYTYYVDKVELAEPDIALRAAEDDGWFENKIPAPGDPDGMTDTENPLTVVLDLMRGLKAEAPDAEAEENDAPLRVALVDTAVTDADITSFSVLHRPDEEQEEPEEDSLTHGDRMLSYIREEAPDAEVFSIEALGEDGYGSVSSLVAALEVAMAEGADIINLSMSGYSAAECPVLQAALDKAAERGILVIAAAGNGSELASLYVPGGLDGVITVGAFDIYDERIISRTLGMDSSSGSPFVRASAGLSGGSNYGDALDWLVVADSTSEASARLTGIIVRLGGLEGCEEALASLEGISEASALDIQEPNGETKVILQDNVVQQTQLSAELLREAVVSEEGGPGGSVVWYRK